MTEPGKSSENFVIEADWIGIVDPIQGKLQDRIALVLRTGDFHGERADDVYINLSSVGIRALIDKLFRALHSDDRNLWLG